MIRTTAPAAPPLDQDVPAVQGGAAYLADIERRLAPDFARAEPRQRAMAYLRGLLSPAARKNSWQLAEASGDATPYAFQHLLRRAVWDPEAVRDALRRYLVEHGVFCSTPRKGIFQGDTIGMSSGVTET